jgi:hypothetical protein
MHVAFIAVLTLVVISILLWRRGEVPILLFVCMYQWAQASIGIFYAGAIGADLNELLGSNTKSVEEATLLSLGGLIALAVGLRLGAGPRRPLMFEVVRAFAVRCPTSSWLKIYMFIWVVTTSAQASAYIVPSLSQPLLAVGNMKWAGYMLFTITTFASPNANRMLWAAAFAIELLLSFGGYFADFKLVFIYTVLALGASRARLSASRVVVAVAIMSVMLMLGVVWSAIKVEYRSFIDNPNAQAAKVETGERWAKLAELITELDEEKLANGARDMVMRVSYVDFFGSVIDLVPKYLPHEGGALWFDAVSRPLMPRLLFPNKEIIDDSELTRKFTGRSIAGSDAGTSISIGYMGETYIDFGPFGMMLALLSFGSLLGGYYKWMIYSQNANNLFGACIVSPVLMTVVALESALSKMVGGFTVNALVGWLIVRYGVPRLLKWLKAQVT